MRKNRLKWFERVMRRDNLETVIVVIKMYVEVNRERGRPKKTWIYDIKSDMKIVSANGEEVGDQDLCDVGLGQSIPFSWMCKVKKKNNINYKYYN